ncbi:unnamed protein product [Psylliodes chrysocephalus]|uniref:DUF4371 domain-containing protein n=1 Tax=Psylliodes chrysocephalus TaxID=3402493 RepID=A0A9P0D432_9CUCU|nr:unnamed protein product [Psylliodes chrysocephala]
MVDYEKNQRKLQELMDILSDEEVFEYLSESYIESSDYSESSNYSSSPVQQKKKKKVLNSFNNCNNIYQPSTSFEVHTKSVEEKNRTDDMETNPFRTCSKLVAQRYDGAAVMAGHLGGLQAEVKEKFKHAIFVQCIAHRLNLVLSRSMDNIKDCKVFFSTLSGLATFFSKSSKRTRDLDIHVKKRFTKVAPTRWRAI